jgi:pre-mRNA-splicing factor ATP-dependent RNA helicase DHX38/PRP16
MASVHADHNTWEENRMVTSGVVRVREVDLDFETEEEQKVMLLVHDTRPPFLEGEHGLRASKNAKDASVLPVKDPTSDLAMIARRGSTLLKEVRLKRDENKSRDRFWEMKGTKMGSVTGTTRAEDEEAALNAEKQRRQAGEAADDEIAGADESALPNNQATDESEIAAFKSGAKFSSHVREDRGALGVREDQDHEAAAGVSPRVRLARGFDARDSREQRGGGGGRDRLG